MSAYIFDTETTGLEDPEVIEAAWLKMASFDEIESSFHQFYKPSKPIDCGALAVHNIIDEYLVDCDPSGNFSLPNDAEYIIGHNIDFDWKVARSPEVKRICTLALSRHLWPTLSSHSQSAVLYHLSDDRMATRELLKNAHDALCDVQNCHILLKKIIKKLGSVSSWEELHKMSEIARIPTVFTFGKHKGCKISEAPQDYKNWLKRQPDVDPYLLKALNN